MLKILSNQCQESGEPSNCWCLSWGCLVSNDYLLGYSYGYSEPPAPSPD